MESYMNRISNTGIVPVVKILEKEDAYPLAKALLMVESMLLKLHIVANMQRVQSKLFQNNYQIC